MSPHPRLDAGVLVRARNGLWYDRVVEYNRLSNAGEEHHGVESLAEITSQAVAFVLELERSPMRSASSSTPGFTDEVAWMGAAAPSGSVAISDSPLRDRLPFIRYA